MRKYRVMIVEDQAMTRHLLEMFIKSSKKYELVFSLDNASMADVYCAGKKIDLVLMDVLMERGYNGLYAAERIKKHHPDTKIILVTSMPECSYIKRARQIGVESFWYKEASQEAILSIMDRTMAGESVYPEQTPVLQIGHAKSTEFTERELDVLREMIKGITNAVIAKNLGIREETVKVHIKHLLGKTGLSSRTDLAIKARVSGLVISDEEGI